MKYDENVSFRTRVSTKMEHLTYTSLKAVDESSSNI